MKEDRPVARDADVRASANSLPAPHARPRMAEIVTAGILLSRYPWISTTGWPAP